MGKPSISTASHIPKRNYQIAVASIPIRLQKDWPHAKKMVEGILLLAQAQIIIFVGNNLSFEGANNDNNVSFALLSCDALYNLNF